ncbi:MAG TPA: hypothetical protein VFN50_06075 [Acidimicrobiales bacterium]|nr:hypothetical protein [Acidimicrobiales bacterium]
MFVLGLLVLAAAAAAGTTSAGAARQGPVHGTSPGAHSAVLVTARAGRP